LEVKAVKYIFLTEEKKKKEEKKSGAEITYKYFRNVYIPFKSSQNEYS
jgi:hypothetical protein